MRNPVRGFALFLFIGVCCRADLTLSYAVDAPNAPPKVLMIRVKGDKTLMKRGALAVIIDSSNSAVTLINPASKLYAQGSMTEYIDGLRAKLPLLSAAYTKNLQFEVETSKTGRSEMISGIRAEEHFTKMTVSTRVQGIPQDSLARLEVHTWLASPDDVNEVPALRHYAESAQRALNVSAAEGAVERVFQQLPGAAEKLRVLTQETARTAGSLTLKLQEAVYNLTSEPNVPISAVTIQLAEISGNAIDDSIFEVPPDFQRSSVAKLINASAPVPQAPPISRTGAGVSAPAVIYKTDPKYTREALQAKLEGSVTLKIVVGSDGLPKNIQVAKSLGLGLDEKAIEAVSQWKFRPGAKDGQPVNVVATVVVNFKLLDRPALQ